MRTIRWSVFWWLTLEVLDKRSNLVLDVLGDDGVIAIHFIVAHLKRVNLVFAVFQESSADLRNSTADASEMLQSFHLTYFWISHSSHSRVGIRARHRLSGGRVRRDARLRRGLGHHLRVRQSAQGSTRRGMEVGRLQRRRGFRQHGVPRICRRQGKPSRRSLGHEPSQQWGGKNGGFS